MIIDYLQKLVDFTNEEISFFESGLQKMSLKKNDYFNRQGKTCNTIGFINSGVFEMSYIDNKGIRVILEFLIQNEFVTDYISFITQSPSNLDLIALSDCEIISFNYSFVNKLYDKGSNFEKFGRLVAERYLIEMANRIHNSYLSPKEKYEYLVKNRQELIQKIPQYKIASYLGVTPEWLSRLRKK